MSDAGLEGDSGILPVWRGSFEIRGTALCFAYCHCKSCQKSSGSAHVSNIGLPKENLTWLAGQELIQVYTDEINNPGFRRSFCRNCGCFVPKISRNGQMVRGPSGLRTPIPASGPMSSSGGMSMQRGSRIWMRSTSWEKAWVRGFMNPRALVSPVIGTEPGRFPLESLIDPAMPSRSQTRRFHFGTRPSGFIAQLQTSLPLTSFAGGTTSRRDELRAVVSSYYVLGQSKF